MQPSFKQLTDFLLELGAEQVSHSEKSYLAHNIGVYNYMKARGCNEELCRAGLFHSIYGTESFQRFSLPLERRPEVRALIGERAERLAYLNCFMDHATFDQALLNRAGPYRFRDRLSGAEVDLSEEDFTDLCKIHLYDWLEQVPRTQRGLRREGYRRMATRLGGIALESYDRVFAAETAAGGHQEVMQGMISANSSSAKKRRNVMLTFESGVSGEGDSPERMAEFFGPGQIDQTIRQAVQFCWMALPKERRTTEEVEKQLRRLLKRALKDFREDLAAFGN